MCAQSEPRSELSKIIRTNERMNQHAHFQYMCVCCLNEPTNKWTFIDSTELHTLFGNIKDVFLNTT